MSAAVAGSQPFSRPKSMIVSSHLRSNTLGT